MGISQIPVYPLMNKVPSFRSNGESINPIFLLVSANSSNRALSSVPLLSEASDGRWRSYEKAGG